jgi:tetratricopeptide (TPR) repeat protein
MNNTWKSVLRVVVAALAAAAASGVILALFVVGIAVATHAGAGDVARDVTGPGRDVWLPFAVIVFLFAFVGFVARRRGTRLSVVAVALIAVAVWASYENNTRGRFVFDDDEYIVENDSIKRLRFESRGALTEDLQYIFWYSPFRFLTTLTFAVNYRYSVKETMNGQESATEFLPMRFHILNNYIHFMAAVLAFFVVRKIIMLYRGDDYKGWAGSYFPALIAAMLFAVCPVNVESVTYIVQRSESMCSMFMLAGMLCFLYARGHQMRRHDKADEGSAKGRQKAATERPRTYAWLLGGFPLLAIFLTLASEAMIAAARMHLKLGDVLGPEQLRAIQSKALLTTLIVGAVYLLLLIAGATAFPRKIQWKGDLLIAASFILFGMAALSKQIAIIFPFLLLLIEAAVLRRGMKGHMRAAIKYHAVFLITLAVVPLLWLSPLGQPGDPLVKQEGKMDTRYFAQQLSDSVIMKYAGLLFMPLHLNMDPDIGLYGERPGDTMLTVQFGALVLLIIFAVALHKYSRLAAFGLFWFFLMLVPASSVFKLSDLMAEHRVYLASLGIFMAVGFAITEAVRLRRSRAVRIAAAAAVVLCLAVIVLLGVAKARDRNAKYNSAVTLWGDTIKNSPNKARPYTGVGFEHMNRGSVEAVIKEGGGYQQMREALQKVGDEGARADIEKFDETLDNLSLELARARVFLDTAMQYDQYDLWIPEALRLEDPTEKHERFARIHLNRIYNNLGVAYSYESEILQMRGNYAKVLSYDEQAIQSQMMYSWIQALKCYGLSLGLNTRGIEALVNSSKIRWSIALKYLEAAANLEPGPAREKLLTSFENEANISEVLAIKAIILNYRAGIALEQMKRVEEQLTQYYTNGMRIRVGVVQKVIQHDSMPLDEREKRALVHLRYFMWMARMYPVDPTELQAAESAIGQLQRKYPDEPDPTAKWPQS